MPKRKKKALDPVEDFDKPVKQERLEGMQDAAIEEIEEAAAICKAFEQKRMTLLRKEMDARDLLGAIMLKHGRSSYRYRGWEVTTTEVKSKVKVKFHPEEADGAISDNPNPGGENSASEGSTSESDRKQPALAGASTEASQEDRAARKKEGFEDGPPF